MANRSFELQLPEEIIQHIQSLMDEKTAARSALLSKSWYGAWSTRPNLHFSQSDFGRRIDEFPEFTKKIMQRYEDRNQKIKALRLRMEGNQSLATELILKAIKLGVLTLTVQIPTTSATLIVLPDEVLESETLATLFVYRVTIDLQKRSKVVTCSNLRSLTVLKSTVNGDIVRDLISKCPLIEHLISDEPMSLFLDNTTIKLKYLHLEFFDNEDRLYRHDLWPKFPFLKKLVICDHFSDHDWNGVRICSPLLEHIIILLGSNGIVNAEFDVPNIRTFKFRGRSVPRLEIKTSSRKWKSHISINCLLEQPGVSWFSSLNVLVKMLSPSRVSLSIFVCESQDDNTRYVGDGSCIPAVENLMLNGHARAVTPAFLENLFLSCRPNFINVEQENVELVRQLRSLPWMTLLDASTCKQKLVRFQLK